MLFRSGNGISLSGNWVPGRAPVGSYLVPFNEYQTLSDVSPYFNPGYGVSKLHFGNAPVGEIYGSTFYDWNQNLARDQSESGVSGWKVYITGPEIDSALTDGSGNYGFTQLSAGTYLVTEGYRSGWKETFPATSLFSAARDTMIDVLNETFQRIVALASDAYRYRLTATKDGGGGGVYMNYGLPYQLAQPGCTNLAGPPPWCVGLSTYSVNVVSYDSIQFHGQSAFHGDRKSTRLNSSHIQKSRMPSSA